MGIVKIASMSTPKVQPTTRKSRVRSHVDYNDDQRLSHRGMGKRKKSSRKPTGPRKREPLGGWVQRRDEKAFADLLSSATTFTCLFCHHDNSVNIRVDRKEGVALLVCKVCDQRYQSKVNRTSPFLLVYTLSLTHFAY